MIENVPSGAKINSLTSMRGIAAISVLLYHAWAITFYGATAASSPSWASFLIFGAYGVSFFFVLSGYLLIGKWLRGDYRSLREFYLRRVFRTFPLYYIALAVVTLVLGVYTFHPLSLLYLQEYFPSTFDNSVFWTLCAEEAFYFSLPLLMKTCFMTKDRTIVTTVLSGALAVAIYAGLHSSYDVVYFTIFYWFVSYSFGALLAHGVRPNVGKLKALAFLACVWALTVSIPQPEVWGATLIQLSANNIIVITSIYSTLVSSAFWVAIPAFETSGFLNRNRITIYLGTISYSIYIWHQFIIHWIRMTFFVPPPMPLDFSLLAGCIGIVVAIASYHFIERPFMKLGRIISKKVAVSAPKS